MREALPRSWRNVLGALARELHGRPDANALADHVYLRHFTRFVPGENAIDRASGDPAFVERAALALQDARGWEHGWEVIQRAGDWSFVHSGRMQLFVHADSESHPARARVGEHVAVLMPCLREGLVPHFLYAFSRAGAIDPCAPHVRIYLNVDAERGLALMQALLLSKSFAKLRFEAKIPNDPAAFDRCDTMLVYAHADDARAILKALRTLRRQQPRGWRKATPFAALQLEPGIALAESPPLHDDRAQSFGQHRSALVATALVEGLRAGERTPRLWAARLATLLRAEGIDPARPHGQRLPAKLWDSLCDL
ncbi:MAG: hypothetical protein JST54_21860 [Deltaproteobacteria bacterium]|nr:hypothetical protein [Deltaproteobacteria bacterium]